MKTENAVGKTSVRVGITWYSYADIDNLTVETIKSMNTKLVPLSVWHFSGFDKSSEARYLERACGQPSRRAIEI